MATQTLEFNAVGGQTFVCKLFEVGSDIVVATANATEKANDVNRYSVEFTDIPAGAYRLNAFIGAVGGFANEVYEFTLPTGNFLPRSESAVNGAAIATAVRAELATELARIDADLSSRLAADDYVAPPESVDLSPEAIQEVAEAVASNVTPGVGSSAEPVDLTKLRPFQGETVTQTVPAYAPNSTTPLDLSGKTFVLLFETEREAFVASIPNNQLTIGGAANNVLTFTYPAAVTADRAPKVWSLRDAADPRKVYLHGLVEIRRTATKTA